MVQIIGQASSQNAKAVGVLAEAMAKTGWKLACKETESKSGGGGFGGTKTGDSTKRMYSTSTHAGSPGERVYIILVKGTGCRDCDTGISLIFCQNCAKLRLIMLAFT